MLQYILASGIGRSEKDVITILSTTMFLQEYVYIYILYSLAKSATAAVIQLQL